ncbi:MAG: Alpha-L-fucosidase [Candidatus Hydrogenedentes bacterium ADurb.Bin179]|nr:MAG: Alpha-L-fucosidase [Candidatus Hydrogenedentes bacterium ADurb.Bin179]
MLMRTRYDLILLSVLSAAVLFSGCPAFGQGYDKEKYEPDWESLQQYEVPRWYLDAKFGIFIHWGVYAVPAFGNEWYPRNMYREGSHEYQHHVETYGPQAQFGYKDFIPLFKGENYNPKEWAALFKQAGARYVVPVAEHHDGFQLYDSQIGEYNSVKMGPKRDIVGELAAAVRDEGLIVGVSSHRAEHWWFFDGGMQFDSDVRAGTWNALYGPAQPEKGAPPDKAFLEDWLARCKELVDKYQPQVFWFDWWIEQPVFEPYRQQFAAYYYNRGLEWDKGVVINYKNASFPDKAAVLDVERGTLDHTRDQFWQTDTSASIRSWGYIENDTFRSPTSLIHELVDIVSKNGCLLLNIGPHPDGAIPEEAQKILREIGRWLKINGEAIYDTRPWTKFGEGPTQSASGSFSDHKEAPLTAEDIRFTRKGNVLYAVVMDWPKERFRVVSLGKNISPDINITSVSLLGSQEPLTWRMGANGLEAEVPERKPCKHAYTLKITLAE